ncbi:MAG: hypothetical protein ACK53Y_01805, partial [bacterium]
MPAEIKIVILITLSTVKLRTAPGSGAFLTPGSGIRNGFVPSPGSRIPRPYSPLVISPPPCT